MSRVRDRLFGLLPSPTQAGSVEKIVKKIEEVASKVSKKRRKDRIFDPAGCLLVWLIE